MTGDPKARKRAIDDLQRAVDETEGGVTAEKRRNLRRAVRRERGMREEQDKE